MALSGSTARQSESISNHTTLFFTTDATAAVKTYVHLGYVPRYVRFVNLTDRIIDEFWKGMTADNSLHTLANGTVSLAGSGGITLEDGTAVSVANSVIMPDQTLVLQPVSGVQYVSGFSVPAALMVASKSFAVTAIG